MDNTVTLIGNLVEAPELRYTGSNIAMVNIRIAVNRRYRDRSDQWQEQTSFFGGTLWRDQAENAAQSLSKGDRVLLSGTLEQRNWENNEGEKRSVVEIRIDDIAPSLRWATAQVTRRASASGGSGSWGGGNAGGDTGGNAAGNTGGNAGGNIPAAPVARDNFGPDEAPF